jgi:His-Xaa-Ser system protein HxsD
LEEKIINRIDVNLTFSIDVDTQIYDDTVISKAIYWHTANFVIHRVVNKNFETITFQAKESSISENERENVLAKFNQDLNDYKLRQIISQETKDIRTILYVKAFANNDDFEEYE